LIFWKVLLAHLLADFLFQPDSIAKNKKNIKFLLLHILIFFSLSFFFLLPNITSAVIFFLILLSIFHGVVDFLKENLQTRFHNKTILFFVGDQLVHLVGIAIFVEIVQKSYFKKWGDFIHSAWENPKIFIIASFTVLIVFGGGYLTGLICKGFFNNFLKRGEKLGLENAGRYIGIFERTLIMIAILIGRYEFIGFLIAAKSIARYPEISKEIAFAEYFLVGTLTSVTIAILGSLALRCFIQ
jgi:hypothetical protein